jgi:hypothetical protein
MVLFTYVVVVGGTAFVAAARHPFRPGAEIALVLPLMCVSVAGLGLAVRRARLRIEPAGIRWGWTAFGVRMGPSRLRGLVAYRDAVAVRPRRGSMWFLSASDWSQFDGMVAALRRAGLEVEEQEGRAPLRARLQSYGRVLDLLMITSAVVSTLLLAAALG